MKFSEYDLAMLFLPNIGPTLARRIYNFFEDIKDFFYGDRKDLMQIQGLGTQLINSILKEKNNAIKRAEKEINFIQKHNIKVHFFKNKDYPSILNNFDDSPIFLFSLGDFDFNDFSHYLSIVGTRQSTVFGQKICKQIIKDLSNSLNNNLIIISGLAYGIDYCAHQTSLENNIPTIAVLGHGLDTIYPSSHKNLAKRIIEKGGAIITEYPSFTKIDKKNFVRRNRIIAALSKGTLIVEAGSKSGALLTAEYAFNYNKIVMAIPGRPFDEKSKGCNLLIKTNKAALVESAEDILKELNWDLIPKQKKIDFSYNLNENHKKIIDTLRTKDKMHIDELVIRTGLSMSQLQSLLFELELQQIILRLPGNFFTVLI